MDAVTPDHVARATALLAKAAIDGPREHCGPPGSEVHCTWTEPIWTVDLIDELNMTVDVGAESAKEARSKVVEHVADVLRQRDPDYVAPQPPSVADAVLAALDGIDTATATVVDVVATVKEALVEAGANPTR